MRASVARMLRRVESIVPRRAQGYGGKARNLAVLARAGFPVPAAWALPGSACEEFLRSVLPEQDRPAALLAAPPGLVAAARLEEIAQRVREASVPDAIATGLIDAFDSLRREGAEGVAVRSSSTREDQEAASAAGLHLTILNVRDHAALLSAAKQCWASLFAPRVLTYLRTLGGDVDASIGLLVQAVVPADVSGVLFTVNPLTGDAGEMVINASWGLGPAIADGRVSPDTWRIDKATRAPRDRVAGEKAIRTAFAPRGGVCDEEVPEELRGPFCLDEATVDELVTLGERIEAHFDDPRDVEWAVAGGQIFVLQARPVTTVVRHVTTKRGKKRMSRSERAHLVWSNANVGEALPGVATPLTWSVLSAFSELGFRRAFGSIGCSVPKDAELFGSFRGRIYLNLSEFVSIASQVPGLKPRTLFEFGGGGEVETLEAQIDDRSSWGFLARLPLTVTRFARENFRLAERVEVFEQQYAEERRRFHSLDLRVLAPAGLDHTLRDVERLLDDAGAVMLTCYGNLLASATALRAVLRLVAPGNVERLERELMTGLADVDSAAPGLSLWHIAEMLRTDAPARDVILAGDPHALRIEKLPDGPTRRALERFVEAYGHRGPREAEIAEPRWSEDPSLLFTALQIHSRREGAVERPIDVERRQRALRDAAQADLERRLPAPLRAAVRHLLALVQRFTRVRERLRGYVTEVLGMFRRVALDASERIERREPDAGRDAAFFLTLDELHGVLRGDIPRVAALVRQRRRQYERDRSLPDPPDTFVGYPPPAPERLAAADAATGVLTGLGASSGVVEGVARVLASAADASDLAYGEILIAPYADVGWSPLFLVASAVVTDLGGPLSHAAIVLREYGVPAVVNVKVGTRVVRTGDRVRVDGDAGTVEIVARAGAALERSAPAFEERAGESGSGR